MIGAGLVGSVMVPVIAAAVTPAGTAAPAAAAEVEHLDPAEVVDLEFFIARAEQWSDARSNAQADAIERARQLVSAGASATSPSGADPADAASDTPVSGVTALAAGDAVSVANTPSDDGATGWLDALGYEDDHEHDHDHDEAGSLPAADSGAGSESANDEQIAEAAPATAPATTAAPVTVPAVTSEVVPLPAGTTEEQWHALRECESNQNYSIVNRTGKYRGAYQFSVRTWNWVAEMHYPHLAGVDPALATPPDQDRMAYKLYEINGWSPWPVCRTRLPG